MFCTSYLYATASRSMIKSLTFLSFSCSARSGDSAGWCAIWPLLAHNESRTDWSLPLSHALSSLLSSRPIIVHPFVVTFTRFPQHFHRFSVVFSVFSTRNSGLMLSRKEMHSQSIGKSMLLCLCSDFACLIYFPHSSRKELFLPSSLGLIIAVKRGCATCQCKLLRAACQRLVSALISLSLRLSLVSLSFSSRSLAFIIALWFGGPGTRNRSHC